MFHVNQKVWCALFGEGVVTKVRTNSPTFPVLVQFEKELEHYTSDGKYLLHAAQTLFPYPVEIVKKAEKPSINWEHVSNEFSYLAEDSDGAAYLYENKPYTDQDAWGVSDSFGEVAEASMFASYVKGTCDWKDSLIQRPDGDNHDD
jgi:hypothetical protein